MNNPIRRRSRNVGLGPRRLLSVIFCSLVAIGVTTMGVSAGPAAAQDTNGWPAGQSVLLQPSDAKGVVSDPTISDEEWSLEGEALTTCDNDNLLGEVASGGSDIARGSWIGQSSYFSFSVGGYGFNSLAINARSSEGALALASRLTKLSFWECVAGWDANYQQQNGGQGSVESVKLLSNDDPSGHSKTFELVVNSGFLDYTDWVVIDVGSAVALLLLDSNLQPFGTPLRKTLTALVEARMQALPQGSSPGSSSTSTTENHAAFAGVLIAGFALALVALVVAVVTSFFSPWLIALAAAGVIAGGVGVAGLVSGWS
jgi:hypothetical protein